MFPLFLLFNQIPQICTNSSPSASYCYISKEVYDDPNFSIGKLIQKLEEFEKDAPEETYNKKSFRKKL